MLGYLLRYSPTPPSAPMPVCTNVIGSSETSSRSETLYCILMLPLKPSMLFYIELDTAALQSVCCQLSHTRVHQTQRQMRIDSLHATKRPVPRHTCISYTATLPFHRMSHSSSSSSTCLIHIDFSENYSCRNHSEIQSVHFGG